MNSEFHAMKAEETMQALESSAQGLSEEEVESRLQKFGPKDACIEKIQKVCAKTINFNFKNV